MSAGEVPKSIRASLYIDGKPAENTITNLTQVTQKLRREFNGLTVGTAEFNAKAVELKNVSTYLAQAKNEAKGLGDAMGAFKEAFTGVFESLGIGFGIGELISFGKELVGLEVKASGVERAFARIGNTVGLVAQMQEASRGMIAELDLQKLAIRANEFNVPMAKLPLLLEFAAERARDTNKDVTELTDKLIDGLGRNGSRSLVELGISAKELNDEMKKTPDRVDAISNIIKRDMAGAGKDVDDLGDRFIGLGKTISNLWDKIGDKIVRLFNQDVADPKNIAVTTSKALGRYGDLSAADKDQLERYKAKQQILFDEAKKIKDYYQKQYDIFHNPDPDHPNAARENAIYSDPADQLKKANEAYQGELNTLRLLTEAYNKKKAAVDGSVRAIDAEIASLKLEQQESEHNADWKIKQAKIDALEKQKEAITGPSKKEIKSGESAHQKALEEKKKFLDESKKLDEQYADFSASAQANTESKDQKEVDDLKLKFDKEIRALQDFLDKNKDNVNRNETEMQVQRDHIAALQLQKQADVNALLLKQQKEAAVAAKKEQDEELKATVAQITAVKEAAAADLDKSENNALGGIKPGDPKGEENQRYIIQQSYAQKRYDLEKKFLEMQKELYTAYGKDTAKTDKDIADNAVKEALRAAGVEIHWDKEIKAAKKEIQTQEMDDLTQGAQFLEGILNKKSALYAAALIVDKAVAVARVIIDTNVAIAAFAAANAGIPIVGEALIAEYTVAARISEAISIASIVAATASGLSGVKFAEGGMTGAAPAGYVGQPTIYRNSASGRPFMAGEAGTEWIAPNWMVKSPRYANIIGMLESARQDKRAYAAGGYNGADSNVPSAPAGGSARLDRIESALHDFIHEQARINAIPVVLSRRVQEQEDAKVIAIRNAANGK